MLEQQYTETGRRLLAGIAMNQVTDANVDRMAKDYRQELTQLLAVGQISEDFYGRWDRIASGLHQPDDEELEEMKVEEMLYGPVDADLLEAVA